VEIVVVGREILRGRIRDDNAAWIGAELSLRGAIVHRVTIVDDSERAVNAAVSEALVRKAGLVVTTGGLGPTLDDRTLAGVADAVRLPLAPSAPARAMVEKAYSRLEGSREVERSGLTAAREKLCTILVGSEAIENPEGVAPGVWLKRTGGAAVLCLPGLPDECRAVFDRALPMLKGLLPHGVQARREVETPTKDESALRPWLDRVAREHPGVWIKAHASGFGKRKGPVVVTLETFAPTRKEAELLVDGALRRLLALAGGGGK
jgi:molybdenum cofactor synthesis domain-containing protein